MDGEMTLMEGINTIMGRNCGEYDLEGIMHDGEITEDSHMDDVGGEGGFDDMDGDNDDYDFNE